MKTFAISSFYFLWNDIRLTPTPEKSGAATPISAFFSVFLFPNRNHDYRGWVEPFIFLFCLANKRNIILDRHSLPALWPLSVCYSRLAVRTERKLASDCQKRLQHNDLVLSDSLSQYDRHIRRISSHRNADTDSSYCLFLLAEVNYEFTLSLHSIATPIHWWHIAVRWSTVCFKEHHQMFFFFPF